MQHTIDVILSVYGKPWQTLCALKSLMWHSGFWIDKIYFIEEKFQPYNDNVKWVLDKFDNIIHYIPSGWLTYPGHVTSGDMDDPENRYIFRYQYGIEKSDKEYVFITHNDIFYNDDIIGNMRALINDNAGIGLIGQCWNCPAFKANVCNGSRYNNYNPKYENVIELMKIYSPARSQFRQYLDTNNTKPMPECRLNEFACLINRVITMKECVPNGDSHLFGVMDILDTGCIWFKDLSLKGYKFVNYDINEDSDHGYFSKVPSEIRKYTYNSSFYVSGYPTQLNEQLYWKAEQAAKKYYEQNYRE